MPSPTWRPDARIAPSMTGESNPLHLPHHVKDGALHKAP
jgi:hypothetical protein